MLAEGTVIKGEIFNGPTNIDLCLNGLTLGRPQLFLINFPEQEKEKVRLEFLIDSLFNLPSDDDSEDDSGPGATSWIIMGRLWDSEQFDEIFGKLGLVTGPHPYFIAEYSSYKCNGKIKFILGTDFLRKEIRHQKKLLAKSK